MKTKKIYSKPQVEIVDVRLRNSIATGSVITPNSSTNIRNVKVAKGNLGKGIDGSGVWHDDF